MFGLVAEVDVKVLAELPMLPIPIKSGDDVKTDVDAGPVISSVGFVKDEIHSDITIKTEPKDEVIMDNGLPLPRPEENDDQVHDDVFGDQDISNDEANDGEEQVCIWWFWEAVHELRRYRMFTLFFVGDKCRGWVVQVEVAWGVDFRSHELPLALPSSAVK